MAITTPSAVSRLSNVAIAARLDDVANLLEEQGANQHRVQAWRGGAIAIRGLMRSVPDVLRDEGIEGLNRIPSIGPALARAVRELAETGRLAFLERLRGGGDSASPTPSTPKASTPSGGIHDDSAPPPVDELLDVDREYRERAARGELIRIAPRRHNPSGERWLPILHAARDGRHYTALFSNTATAHRLGHTHDWVIIYFDGRDGERQCTVVTASKGPLAHRRIVRGRESECTRHYHLDSIPGAHPPASRPRRSA